METEQKEELKKQETEQNVEIDRISVRNLVEFILRSGDIDDRMGGGGPDKEAMQMGSRLHRKIQGRQGGDYQAEVALAGNYPCDDFVIRVEGRADGIIQNESGVIIDEIKGVLRPIEHIKEPVPVHLAQAKCYAYFYATDQDLSEIGVRMSYCNLESEEMKYFHFTYSYEELEEWFLGVLEEYKKWARFSRQWKEKRTESIHQTPFPFPYRPGQKELAADVYRTIARGKTLFIQAPTGVGKTLTTVFPAVKAMGEGKGDKIFYLTAKTIARTVASEAFAQLRDAGLSCKSIVLTAKDKMCKCAEPKCNPDACPYAKGHFDRINDAVFALLNQEDVFTRDLLDAAADQYMVCPFELSLDLSLWVDAIIGDYNYVFHPRSRLKRFFGEGVKGDYLFLIDETHNLVDRGREMYSATLVKEDFLALKKIVRKASPKMAASLERCNKVMLEYKRECERYKVLSNIGTFPIRLMNLVGIMEDYLDEHRGTEISEAVRDLYFQIYTFLDICDRMDECYVIYDELRADGSFALKLFCVDPSVNLQECLDKARGSVLFSATLLPIDYYKRMLSSKTDNYAVYADSCFDPSHLQVLVGSDTSSRYTDRTPEQFRRIASTIVQAVAARKGNYLVFFSSYRMMADVQERLYELADPDMEILAQESGMSEERREQFLDSFTADREKTLIGLCVMGSFFGEGIDLRADRLIGAIVVGTGLPQVNSEQEILKAYYDERGEDGFRYAYLCPGMNKVLQAAGRVIRTEEDRGIVLLLDDRFTRSQYRRMFPREWNDCRMCTESTVRERVTEFWDRQKEAVSEEKVPEET